MSGLNILSVSLLHSALTTRPRYLAGKGEEHWIKKTQTYTTILLLHYYFENQKQYCKFTNSNYINTSLLQNYTEYVLHMNGNAFGLQEIASNG